VLNLCWRVGEALALETTEERPGWRYPQALGDMQWDAAEIKEQSSNHASARRRRATRVGSNLWLVPAAGNGRTEVRLPFCKRHLGEIRRSLNIRSSLGPRSGTRMRRPSIARLADGIVLVLSARHTRRMAARKIKENCKRSRRACWNSIERQSFSRSQSGFTGVYRFDFTCPVETGKVSEKVSAFN